VSDVHHGGPRLTALISRMATNRMITIAIITVLVLLILAVLFSKFK
jgi:vesicle transport through interaction with t-SNAREs protein 1